MPKNERITENIVRDILREQGYYGKGIKIEEQISQIPRIDKLLKNASKSGPGVGKPEFIISFSDNTSLLVVIECKADISKHESKSRDKYKDYAVDGVILYSSYLSKDFDVVAIAVSGQNLKELKISTFTQLKGSYVEKERKDIFEILNYSEYKNILEEQKKPIEDEKLIEKAVDYNKILNDCSIPERDRCIFLSAMLTAIQDNAFIAGYTKLSNNKELVEDMLNACRRVLNRSHVNTEDQKTILYEFEKIQQNKTLIEETIKNKKAKTEEKNTVLKDLIDDLIKNVMPFIKENDFDILGKFYREFIRYAGSDGKTGLVLTPTHITDFFCELADLKYDDVILDPCCGTGGFLVSAMKFMMNSCGNRSEELEKIKAERIIGIELRSDMFTHAYSNMMMRGDGKSNIINDSCFSDNVKGDIKSKKPNKAFLNPPYDGGETVQLEFIENALECLEKTGLCLAICQMSTVVSMKKEAIEIRERLLESHSLKAVISMPNDLFHPVGVVTCILVFEAHKPHPQNKKTFFGYLKDDGHEKQKHKGRINNGSWEQKKEEMLDLYMNNDDKAGLSVTKIITGADEWCAEAYMETDYSLLTAADFAKTLKEYVAFKFLQGGQ